MTELKSARITKVPPHPGRSRARGWIIPLVVAVGVVLLAAYFLQHFPSTLLAVALVLLAIGRLGPVAREVIGIKWAAILQGFIDFAGVGLLALAATQSAAGEIARAFAAVLHR